MPTSIIAFITVYFALLALGREFFEGKADVDSVKTAYKAYVVIVTTIAFLCYLPYFILTLLENVNI